MEVAVHPNVALHLGRRKPSVHFPPLAGYMQFRSIAERMADHPENGGPLRLVIDNLTGWKRQQVSGLPKEACG
jgi:hypothetical protein